jgi:hypothetical protein
MRWEKLFRDLEAEWEAAASADQLIEVADRTRTELARITLLDRLRGSVGRSVRLQTVAGEVAGDLRRVASDCVLVRGRVELLVPVAAVLGAEGLTDGSVPDSLVGEVDRRLGMASLLRAVARDRAAVTVQRAGAPSVHGTPQRVGADFVDLAAHPEGEPPRRGAITGHLVVPFAAVAAVRLPQ